MLQHLQNKLDELRLLHDGPLSCRLFRSSLPLTRKIWQAVAPYQTYEADVLVTEAASLDPAPNGLSCIGWDGDGETIAAFKKWGNLAARVFAKHGQETSGGGYREVVDLLLDDLPERLILDDNPDCGVRNHLLRLRQVPEVWLAEGDDLFDIASRFVKGLQRQPEKSVLAPSDVSTIAIVRITTGPNSFQLAAKNRPPFSLEGEHWLIFMLFVGRIANRAPGETVTWDELNPCVWRATESKPATHATRAQAENHSETKGRSQASPRLRKVLDKLRADLLKWGRPPDGQDWIVTNKRLRGCRLNTSCKWLLDRATWHQYHDESQKAWLRLVDPIKLAQDTPDKESKLPARPQRRRATRDEDAN